MKGQTTIQLISETIEFEDGKAKTILTWQGSKVGIKKLRKILSEGGFPPGFTVSTRAVEGSHRLTLVLPGVHRLPPMLTRL